MILDFLTPSPRKGLMSTRSVDIKPLAEKGSKRFTIYGRKSGGTQKTHLGWSDSAGEKTGNWRYPRDMFTKKVFFSVEYPWMSGGGGITFDLPGFYDSHGLKIDLAPIGLKIGT